MRWINANCDRCWKSAVSNKTGKSRCAIENAIALASGADGSLLHGGGTPPEKAAKVAARLGWDGGSYLESDCPEIEEKRPKYPRHARAAETLPLFSVGAWEQAESGTQAKPSTDEIQRPAKEGRRS